MNLLEHPAVEAALAACPLASGECSSSLFTHVARLYVLLNDGRPALRVEVGAGANIFGIGFLNLLR